MMPVGGVDPDFSFLDEDPFEMGSFGSWNTEEVRMPDPLPPSMSSENRKTRHERTLEQDFESGAPLPYCEPQPGLDPPDLRDQLLQRRKEQEEMELKRQQLMALEVMRQEEEESDKWRVEAQSVGQIESHAIKVNKKRDLLLKKVRKIPCKLSAKRFKHDAFSSARGLTSETFFFMLNFLKKYVNDDKTDVYIVILGCRDQRRCSMIVDKFVCHLGEDKVVGLLLDTRQQAPTIMNSPPLPPGTRLVIANNWYVPEDCPMVRCVYSVGPYPAGYEEEGMAKCMSTWSSYMLEFCREKPEATNPKYNFHRPVLMQFTTKGPNEEDWTKWLLESKQKLFSLTPLAKAVVETIQGPTKTNTEKQSETGKKKKESVKKGEISAAKGPEDPQIKAGRDRINDDGGFVQLLQQAKNLCLILKGGRGQKSEEDYFAHVGSEFCKEIKEKCVKVDSNNPATEVKVTSANSDGESEYGGEAVIGDVGKEDKIDEDAGDLIMVVIGNQWHRNFVEKVVAVFGDEKKVQSLRLYSQSDYKFLQLLHFAGRKAIPVEAGVRVIVSDGLYPVSGRPVTKVYVMGVNPFKTLDPGVPKAGKLMKVLSRRVGRYVGFTKYLSESDADLKYPLPDLELWWSR